MVYTGDDTIAESKCLEPGIVFMVLRGCLSGTGERNIYTVYISVHLSIAIKGKQRRN